MHWEQLIEKWCPRPCLRSIWLFNCLLVMYWHLLLLQRLFVLLLLFRLNLLLCCYCSLNSCTSCSPSSRTTWSPLQLKAINCVQTAQQTGSLSSIDCQHFAYVTGPPGDFFASPQCCQQSETLEQNVELVAVIFFPSLVWSARLSDDIIISGRGRSVVAIAKTKILTAIGVLRLPHSG